MDSMGSNGGFPERKPDLWLGSERERLLESREEGIPCRLSVHPRVDAKLWYRRTSEHNSQPNSMRHKLSAAALAGFVC
ncbi:hypothetical protein PISMIDRAFT_383819 [Pisolithus microcarpus 441]|uniref:Uncharacterized protein n=1 Tax=Pisolithus microcarpus 441 TaxID=765257 RepID=A0A0C9ZVP8_9AGAM|nr:hypothetical protein PISMIDRAFT_383819 [Pisolithus microcarpus 441]